MTDILLEPLIDTIYLKFPPKKVIPATVVLHNDELREVVTWCHQTVGEFIEAAIRDRLDDVQAAMAEESISES